MAARGGRKQLSRCVRALDEDQGEHKSCCLCLCRILVAYLIAGNIKVVAFHRWMSQFQVTKQGYWTTLKLLLARASLSVQIIQNNSST